MTPEINKSRSKKTQEHRFWKFWSD